MIMQRKYGLEWPMHPGPSQDDRDRAARIEEAGAFVFDRYEQLLIFRSPEAADSALAGMSKEWRDTVERCDLLMVSNDAVITPYDRFSDFAFQGGLGTTYFDLQDVAVFRLHASQPEAEPAPAVMQLEEHLIASCGEAWQVIERQLAELAERIARAYRCEIEWLDVAHP